MPPSFEITDELYLYEVFEDSVVPLLKSRHAFVRDNFYSAALAVREGKLYSNEGWTHSDGSPLVGWVKRHLASPIAFLQFGDDPVAYENPHFKRLLQNAVHWAASEDARAWARESGQNAGSDPNGAKSA